METNSQSPLRNRQRRLPNPGRRGIANIWVALLALVLIGMTGLACDVAYVLLVVNQLQNAADAAALAGAQQVRRDVGAAWQASLDMAQRNYAGGEPVRLTENPANDPIGDIVIGFFSRQMGEFTPTFDGPNAVKVVARRTSDSLNGAVPLLFGSIFVVKTINVERTAIAMASGGTGAGLIALDLTERQALRVHGTVTLTVNDGAIQVNSNHDSQAVYAGGNVVIDAPTMNVGGDARFTGGAQFTGDLNPGASPIPDPLAFLPPPVWNPANSLGTISVTGGETVNLKPGFYSGGISANNGTVTLAPGIYILDGEGLNITGNTNFTAEGVMFYITGTGTSCLDLTGTGDIRVTPPDPGLYTYPDPQVNTYEGVSIFQDRTNTNAARIIGTSLLDLEGTLYFRKAHVELGGTGDGFGNQLIANTVEVGGTGAITVNYDGRFPAPGNKPFLVY